MVVYVILSHLKLCMSVGGGFLRSFFLIPSPKFRVLKYSEKKTWHTHPQQDFDQPLPLIEIHPLYD